MYELKYSRRFKKDLKKIRREKEIIMALENILNILKDGKKLDDKFCLHRFRGEFRDCYECHVMNDVLLIYKANKKSLLVLLLRIGSHSDLF